MQPVSPSPHAHALRKGRHAEPGHTYLLTAVIKDRRPLFSEWESGRLLVTELRATEQQGLVQSLAWVVMPDHLHWLVTLQSASLSTLMRRIKGRSAIAINKMRKSQGPIWQPGFHDHALREEDDMPAIARYIVANPLRSGLVEKIGDYPLWDAVWLE